MAMSAKTVIAEAEEIVEPGELDPDEIHTPGIFVHRVIKAKNIEKRIERLMLNLGKMKVVITDPKKRKLI